MTGVILSTELVDFVRPSEHSRFSPSAGDRWINCPFSVKASEPIPEETSKYAAEGTLAHKICEDLFYHKYYEAPKTADLMMCEPEMFESANMYYECVVGWLTKHEERVGKVLWFGLEKGIPIFPHEGCFGTADAVIVGTKGCVIIDFKYGKGRAVSAASTQLQIYLLGLFRHLINIPLDYTFHAVVVQPRLEHIPKVHEYTYEEMKAFEPIVYHAIKQADTEGLTPNAGGHCYWCKAKRTLDRNLKCPVELNKAQEVLKENFDDLLTDMNNRDIVGKDGALIIRDKALIKLLSLEPLVKQVAQEAREEFEDRIRKGETIEGITLRDVKGRAKWVHDDIDLMAKEIIEKYPTKVTHFEVLKTETVRKLINIGEVQKRVGKKNFDESLVVRPIKKEIYVEDITREEVLRSLEKYAKQIGLDSSN